MIIGRHRHRWYGTLDNFPDSWIRIFFVSFFSKGFTCMYVLLCSCTVFFLRVKMLLRMHCSFFHHANGTFSQDMNGIFNV